MKINELKKALPSFARAELEAMLESDSRATAKEAIQAELDARDNGPDEEVAAQEAILSRLAEIHLTATQNQAAINELTDALADAKPAGGETVAVDGASQGAGRDEVLKIYRKLEAVANHLNFRLPG